MLGEGNLVCVLWVGLVGVDCLGAIWVLGWLGDAIGDWVGGHVVVAGAQVRGAEWSGAVAEVLLGCGVLVGVVAEAGLHWGRRLKTVELR